MLKIMLLIENSCYRNFTILADSKSTAQAINDIYSNHPIISKIQTWIIAVQSRHKSITLCWVPSHINSGNEKADKLANQQQHQMRTMHIASPQANPRYLLYWGESVMPTKRREKRKIFKIMNTAPFN